MNHVAFVVKVALRQFQVTLGVLSTTPEGGRAVKAGALSQVTAPQRKTALRAALIAAGLPQDTAVLVVDSAPPAGLQVVTAQAAPAPKAEPEAPTAPKAAPAAEQRKEWLTPAADPVAWLAAYRGVIAALSNGGRSAKTWEIERDCHAQCIACGTKWLDWARAHGVFQAAPKAAPAAPKAAKPALPWSPQAKAHASEEQAKANLQALAAGLPATVRAEWVRAVYKTAYNFALEVNNLPHRFADVGVDVPPMPIAPAQKAA